MLKSAAELYAIPNPKQKETQPTGERKLKMEAKRDPDQRENHIQTRNRMMDKKIESTPLHKVRSAGDQLIESNSDPTAVCGVIEAEKIADTGKIKTEIDVFVKLQIA